MNKKNVFPSCVGEIAEFLRQNPVRLENSGTDRRLDSTVNEGRIGGALKRAGRWDVSVLNEGKAHNRRWASLRVDDCYVDIKTSLMKGADNTGASSHVAYILTGIPDLTANRRNLFRFIRENESPDDDRDFYYLIVNKNQPNDVYPVSLRHIKEVRPSASNLPFQARWDDCREPEYRSWQESRDYLLGKWAESIGRRRRNLNEGMPAYYPEFFEK